MLLILVTDHYGKDGGENEIIKFNSYVAVILFSFSGNTEKKR